MNKVCTKCSIEKEKEEFPPAKTTKDKCSTICRECLALYQQRYYTKNKKLLQEEKKEWYEKNKTIVNSRAKKRNKKIKDLVFNHYGGYKCSCCGVEEIVFLSIDHINGGGNKHRKEIAKSSGASFYDWLIKNNFPEGFRVLCMNCQFAYKILGYCPHKKFDKNQSLW